MILDELGVQVLGVSVDSIHVHKMWNEDELSKIVAGGIKFPLLSDAGGRVGKLFGIYDEEDGLDLRGTFIISPEGKVMGLEVLSGKVGRNIDETIRQLKAFQHVYEVRTDVCPAGWQPGMPTLQPSKNLVGKVWTIWKP